MFSWFARNWDRFATWSRVWHFAIVRPWTRVPGYLYVMPSVCTWVKWLTGTQITMNLGFSLHLHKPIVCGNIFYTLDLRHVRQIGPEAITDTLLEIDFCKNLNSLCLQLLSWYRQADLCFNKHWDLTFGVVLPYFMEMFSYLLQWILSSICSVSTMLRPHQTFRKITTNKTESLSSFGWSPVAEKDKNTQSYNLC